MDFLKAEEIGKNKWRVLSIPFGGPLPGKAIGKPDNAIGYDSDGEFFTRNTDIKPEWFDRRPLVWHHNLDGTMKADPVLGTADDLEQEDDGWWSTLWLDRAHRYFAKIDELLRAGKVYGSSGALPNFVKTAKTGEILVWPFIEQTLTPIPANPYSRVVAAKAVAHFDEANIGLPAAVRDLITDLDSPPADLPADLTEAPSGADVGDEAAIQRLTAEVTRLEGLLRPTIETRVTDITSRLAALEERLQNL